MAENVDGNIEFYETATNERFSFERFDKYIDKQSMCWFMRVDQKEFTEYATLAFKERNQDGR